MRIDYFFRTVNSRGFFETLKIITSGFLKVNKFLVFYKNLEEPFDYHINDSAIKFQKITLNELNFLRNEEKCLPVQFYCDNTHGFSTPYIATIGGNIAAIHWIVYQGEYSRFLELGYKDVELNYNTVLPKYQGKRLAERLMAFIISDCKKENMERMFGVVNADNIPQYKSMLRLGFEPVEVLTHFAFSRPKATLKYVR